MRLLPKSIHRCRRYPTKFNSGRDIPDEDRDRDSDVQRVPCKATFQWNPSRRLQPKEGNSTQCNNGMPAVTFTGTARGGNIHGLRGHRTAILCGTTENAPSF